MTAESAVKRSRRAFRSRGASSPSPCRGIVADASVPRRQAGAALFVSLVLLLLLTLLAVSGMRSAALELAMAGNAQARQHAFEAAESAIEVALSQHTFSRSAAVPLRISLGAAEAEAAITYIESTGVPDATFSLGVGTLGSIQAFHFEVVAVGSGPRGATSTHRQGFYLIGPGER